MAEPVAEQRAEAGRFDDVAGDLVDGDAVGARSNSPEAGELRLEDDVVRMGELVGDVAGEEGPRAVGAVAADLARSVDRDRLARLDHAVAGHGVR